MGDPKCLCSSLLPDGDYLLVSQEARYGVREWETKGSTLSYKDVR